MASAWLSIIEYGHRSQKPNKVSSVSGPAPSCEQSAHRRAFGESVSRLRLERGWTQEDLAERANVYRSYLAAIETVVRNPSLDVIVKQANGLHLPVAAPFT